jgi:hypothetical protein
MADITKRTKKVRKQAGKRAKVARKAAAKTTTRTRVQAGAALLVSIITALATGKLLKRRGETDAAVYRPAPDNLPNEPERPAGTTPMPTAS